MLKIYKNRRNHWSCSKLAHKILEKPYAASMAEWKEWKTEAKANHPVRYFVVEHALDFVQDVLFIPYDIYTNTRRWVYNRIYGKYNVLRTYSFGPTDYADLDRRLLHCNFDALRDYVEIEVASKNYESYKPNKNRFSRDYGRDVKAGLEHLDWEISLRDDPDYAGENGQSDYAEKIRNLYLWWTVERPARINPFDRKVVENDPDDFEALLDMSEEESERIKNLYEWEDEQYKIDTQKLIELMGVRAALW